MPSQITFPNLPNQQPLCQVSDVLNLIGNVAPIATGEITASQIQNAIYSATEYVEQQTNNFFSPRRLVLFMDGNAKSRMVMPYSHILWVNKLEVYFTFPIALERVAHDWDLNIDRPSGIVTFPPYTNAPFFAPFAYTFYRSSQNVKMDAWHGWFKSIWQESPTTSDNLTYTFANSAAFKRTLQQVYLPTIPPSFNPKVFVNGTEVINTTYTLINSIDASANNEWQVETDNIYYTINTGPNGYNGITFNESQAGKTVTVDYDYWYIPYDVTDACAKKASITLLTAFSTATFANQQFQGAVEIVDDGARVQYQGGQWGNILDRWNGEIATVVQKHKRLPLPYGLGYSEDWLFS